MSGVTSRYIWFPLFTFYPVNVRQYYVCFNLHVFSVQGDGIILFVVSCLVSYWQHGDVSVGVMCVFLCGDALLGMHFVLCLFCSF